VKITLNNDFLIVEDPSDSLLNVANEELVYTDKSKQYQLKRLMKSPWSRNSPLVKQLQQEVNGKLFEINGNVFKTSASFFTLLESEFNNCSVQDKRKDTGKNITIPWVNKPHDLRPYQLEAVSAMTTNFRGVVNMATGLGKTLCALHLVKSLKKRTLIVCPSDSVAKQFYELFVKTFGQNKVGFYGGGKKKINDITIGIAASVVKATDEFKKHDLGVIIFDETHHIAANTFFDIAVALSSVGRIYGLTATDYRSDGKDIMITAGCGSVVIRRDVKWGVENGWLAEPYFIVREVRTTGHDYKDDKIKSYKDHVLNCQQMKDRIASDAKSMMAAGKSVLILVDEVAHGKELSEQLEIPFATGIDKNSQDYLDQLNAGKVPGLVATDGKMGEGSDTKNVDVLILANFVASKGPVIQAVGRALRKQGTKTKALILDYIPTGSTMLTRHANNRIAFYREITDKVKLVK
jgi:superfamily II DNA or RNA helicase